MNVNLIHQKNQIIYKKSRWNRYDEKKRRLNETTLMAWFRQRKYIVEIILLSHFMLHEGKKKESSNVVLRPWLINMKMSWFSFSLILHSRREPSPLHQTQIKLFFSVLSKSLFLKYTAVKTSFCNRMSPKARNNRVDIKKYVLNSDSSHTTLLPNRHDGLLHRYQWEAINHVRSAWWNTHIIWKCYCFVRKSNAEKQRRKVFVFSRRAVSEL